MQFMLKQIKNKTYKKSTTGKYSFIQECNLINLPRMSDFSEFCLKLGKADADILKNYMPINFKNDLVTANVANTTKKRQRRI